MGFQVKYIAVFWVLVLRPVQSMELPFCLHPGKALLTQRFIEHNSHRIRQVQGADLGQHWDADAGICVIYQNFFRDACALFSKHNEIIRAIGDSCIGVFRFGGSHPDFGIWMSFPKFIKIDVPLYIQMLPIIHTGSFDFLFV